MPVPTPRLLDDEEIDRQLADLPGVYRGAAGTLVLAARAPSFEEAVQLVRLVAQDAELMNHHPDIDLRWCTVSFTLSTHSAGGLTQLDVELAHQMLQAVAAVGAQSLPAPERVEIAVDVVDADAVRDFWRAGLGYVRSAAARLPRRSSCTPGTGGGPRCGSSSSPRTTLGARSAPGFTSTSTYRTTQAEARVQACLDAGGRLVEDSHAPSWWVLADPEGNELCICTRATQQSPSA